MYVFLAMCVCARAHVCVCVCACVCVCERECEFKCITAPSPCDTNQTYCRGFVVGTVPLHRVRSTGVR